MPYNKLLYCQYRNNYKISYGTVGWMPFRRVCLMSGCALARSFCTRFLDDVPRGDLFGNFLDYPANHFDPSHLQRWRSWSPLQYSPPSFGTRHRHSLTSLLFEKVDSARRFGANQHFRIVVVDGAFWGETQYPRQRLQANSNSNVWLPNFFPLAYLEVCCKEAQN